MSRSEISGLHNGSGSPTGGQAPLRFTREWVPASIEYCSTDLGPYEVHTAEHWRLRPVGTIVATPREGQS